MLKVRLVQAVWIVMAATKLDAGVAVTIVGCDDLIGRHSYAQAVRKENEGPCADHMTDSLWTSHSVTNAGVMLTQVSDSAMNGG